MKKRIYFIPLLFSLLLLGFSSCSSEEAVIPTPDTHGARAYEGTFSLRGYTLKGIQTYSVTAEPTEKSLSHLSVMLFSASDDKYLGTVPAKLPVGNYDPEQPMNVTFSVKNFANGASPFNVKFMPVANLTPSEVETMLQGIGTTPVTDLTYAQIKESAVVSKEPGIANLFVMLGNEKTSDQPFSATFNSTSATSITDNIVLTRLAAKINIKLATTNLDNITLGTVKLVNKKMTSALYEKAPSLQNATTQSQEYNNSGNKVTELLNTIYTYENSVSANTALQLSLFLGDVALKPIDVPMNAVKRNYIYTVTVSRDPDDYPFDPNAEPKLVWNIDVNDWNTGENIVYQEYEDKNAPRITNITGTTGNVTAAAPWTSMNIGVISGNTDFTVETDSYAAEAKATVTDGSDWISLTGSNIKTYGAMQQEFTFSATPNNTGSQRTGKIRFANKLDETHFVELSVVQGTTSKEVSYTLTVTPASMQFAAAGGEKAFTVKATKVTKTKENGVVTDTQTEDISTAYSTTVNGAWLSVNSGKIKAQANSDKTPRNGSVTVSLNESTATQQTISVTQQAFADGVNPKIPMSYFAKTNVNKAGDGFLSEADQFTQNKFGYFNWYLVSGTHHSSYNKVPFSLLRGKTAFTGYHVPSKDEWISVFPVGSGKVFSDVDNVSETVNLGDGAKAKEYKSDFRTINNIAYAIRFKSQDNKFRAAYRYEFVNKSKDVACDYMKVTVRYLGNDTGVTLSEICMESYWKANNTEDVTRVFPKTGYYSSSDELGKAKDSIRETAVTGWYWSTAEYDTNRGWSAYFDSSGSYARVSYGYKDYAAPVRLVRNKE